MSDLSPELQELVHASRGAYRPTDADSARIFEALRSRLGDGAVLGTEATDTALTSSTSGVGIGKLAAAGFLGLAVVGGILFFTTRRPPVAPSAANPVANVAVTPKSEPTPAEVPVAADPTPQASPPVAVTSNTQESAEPRPAASHRGRDNLSEEVAIMSRAETALHAGKPELALRLLSEHERRFANGVLTEERIAARVQALCALNRTTEANAQMARLSPKSLHGAQASQACARSSK